MNRLAELIERVERLTGPDYQIEEDIWRSLQLGPFPPLPVTASLDAAIALTERVLPGWIWLKPRWNELSVYRPADGDCEVVEYASDHSIPAIALVLATLKALAAQEQADG